MLSLSDSRMTRKRKSGEDHRPKADEGDKLLELPEGVLHHILSFLPTIDVVRLSLLSKRWQGVWLSSPALNFSDSSSARPTEFCKHVSKCMRLRKDGFVSGQITSFKLCTSFFWRWSTIDGWLRLASKSKLRDLDIYVCSRPKKWYRVPQDLLSIGSLSRVRLVGVELKDLKFPIHLPFLSSLYLKNVKMTDQVLCILISGCSSLERLCLHTCRGLFNPQVSSSRLKFLEIGYSREDKDFRIETPNLESFVCHQLPAGLESNLSLSRTIRKLSFIDSEFDDLWLEDLVFALPLLESLTLRSCPKVKHVKIHGDNLKGVDFDNNGDCGRARADIFSPNLTYFSYRGHLLPNTFVNLNRNLLKAHIRLYKPQNFCDEWFTNLLNFLSNLNCSESLTLDVHSEKLIIFPCDVREKFPCPLPRLEHLKVRTKCRLSAKAELTESLNWASPSVETLSIVKR